MFNSLRHGRRRHRSHLDLDSTGLIVPTSKKPKYTSIHWNCHLDINSLDQQILYSMSQSIIHSPSDVFCFDIAKTISEYALGWIKICPECKIGEILIIPSRLWKVYDSNSVSGQLISPIICCNCCIQLFIHKCDTCSISFPMHSFSGSPSDSCHSWWLYPKSCIDTKYVPLPESHTCKDCIKEVHPEMLTLYGSNIQCEELCDRCIFECALCNNIYCKKKHLGYYCFQCELYYCYMCQDYCLLTVKHACINCFRNLQKYTLYYPNLQDRLIFDNYFGLLFNNNNIEQLLLSLFIPLNVLHCVARFIDGVIIDCSCCRDGIGQIFASGVYNYRKYIDQKFKCNFGHINYVHYCDNPKCGDKFIVNSISCLKYIAYETPAWMGSVSESDVEIIRENICHICYIVDDKVITLCNDAKCSSTCNECGATVCKSIDKQHCICCILCGDEYCINHSDWLKHTCRICGHAVCPECQYYCAADLKVIECYDLYGLCFRDYSPYMSKFCQDPCEYIQCLDIFLNIRDSNTPFTFLEEWYIITVIAVYAR